MQQKNRCCTSNGNAVTSMTQNAGAKLGGRTEIKIFIKHHPLFEAQTMFRK